MGAVVLARDDEVVRPGGAWPATGAPESRRGLAQAPLPAGEGVGRGLTKPMSSAPAGGCHIGRGLLPLMPRVMGLFAADAWCRSPRRQTLKSPLPAGEGLGRGLTKSMSSARAGGCHIRHGLLPLMALRDEAFCRRRMAPLAAEADAQIPSPRGRGVGERANEVSAFRLPVLRPHPRWLFVFMALRQGFSSRTHGAARRGGPTFFARAKKVGKETRPRRHALRFAQGPRVVREFS